MGAHEQIIQLYGQWTHFKNVFNLSNYWRRKKSQSFRFLMNFSRKIHLPIQKKKRKIHHISYSFAGANFWILFRLLKKLFVFNLSQLAHRKFPLFFQYFSLLELFSDSTIFVLFGKWKMEFFLKNIFKFDSNYWNFQIDFFFILDFFQYVLLILMNFYDEVPWFISLNFHNIHNNSNFNSTDKMCAMCMHHCIKCNVDASMKTETYKWCKSVCCALWFLSR